MAFLSESWLERLSGADLAKLCRGNPWKIDLGISSSIEIVREHVQRDVRDDLRDLGVRKPAVRTRELFVADSAVALENGRREAQRRPYL